jgi:hypothetical protein
MEPYVHEQRSSLLFNAWLAKGVLAFAAGLLFLFREPAAAVCCTILAAIDDGLSKLKMRVDADAIDWEFTYGLPAGTIAIADVRRVQTVRTGFDLWSLAGYQTVAITKRDGRVVRVGTDEPEELIAAIERFRR